jgi:hypothetical protein
VSVVELAIKLHITLAQEGGNDVYVLAEPAQWLVEGVAKGVFNDGFVAGADAQAEATGSQGVDGVGLLRHDDGVARHVRDNGGTHEDAFGHHCCCGVGGEDIAAAGSADGHPHCRDAHFLCLLDTVNHQLCVCLCYYQPDVSQCVPAPFALSATCPELAACRGAHEPH